MDSEHAGVTAGVRLRALRPDDLRLIARWVNDPDTTRYMAAGRIPMSFWGVERWLRRDDEHGAAIYIVERVDADPIGLIGLYEMDWISRKAELRILLGRSRGGGIGTTACRLLLSKAFLGFGLHRVWLGTAADNLAALRCFEKVGFTREGVLRQDLWRGGLWHDNIRMAILRDEWTPA